MKQSLLSTGIVLLVTSLCHSQTLIPKAGITMSKIAAVDDNDVRSKIGYTFGVGYNIALNDLFSIQPELNYVQKGLKRDHTSSFNEDGYRSEGFLKRRLTINYLELPVLAKITFGTKTKFYLNAGPSVAVGLGGKDNHTSDYTNYPQGEPMTVHYERKGTVKFGETPDGYQGEDIYFENRFDVGAQFGGGVMIANKMVIDLRYGLGLSNLYGNDDGDRSKHRVLQFTVGVPLSIK